jgi:uncharacterized protein (UPF0335 family)
MNEFDESQNQPNALVKKVVQPAEVPPSLEEQQQKATAGWWRTLLNKVKGYTASDASRLKEAAISGVEGESAKRVNEAKKLEAEAQMLHAEAEVKRQEAALKSLQIRKKLFELEDNRLDEDIERIERIADATEHLANAISRIRQMGGDVGFDTSQLENMLKQIEKKAKLHQIRAPREEQEKGD